MKVRARSVKEDTLKNYMWVLYKWGVFSWDEFVEVMQHIRERKHKENGWI